MHHPLVGEQVQLHIALDRHATQPLRELGHHQPRGHIRAVDGGLGSAGAGIGFFGGEEGGRVVKVGWAIVGGDDAEDFGGHAAVDEEVNLVLCRVPDQLTDFDLVHAAEQHVADVETPALCGP